jgi:hypothetical protein
VVLHIAAAEVKKPQAVAVAAAHAALEKNRRANFAAAGKIDFYI